MNLLQNITNSIISYFTETYINYNINSKSVKYRKININNISYEQFIVSLYQLFITLKDAKYLRVVDIDYMAFVELDFNSEHINTNIIICLNIKPKDNLCIYLDDTKADISNTIIMKIMFMIDDLLENTEDIRIRDFINNQIFSEGYYTSYTLDDKIKTWTEWMRIIEEELDILNINYSSYSDLYLNLELGLELDLISESNLYYDPNINININTNYNENKSKLNIYELYKEGVTQYLEATYNIRTFYPYNLPKLGSGSYGNVYRLYDNITVKTFTENHNIKTLLTNTIDNSYLREISILSQLDNESEYIIHYYHSDASLFSLYIMMEYGGIILDTFMTENKNMSPDLLSNILFQILSGLQFLEVNKIIHRDIKPGNILIKSNYNSNFNNNSNNEINIKIIDFGMSCTTYESSNNMLVQTETTRSPEITALSGITSLKMDIWSVGIIFYEYITGDNISSTMYKVVNKYKLYNDYYIRALRLLYYSIITKSTERLSKSYFNLWNIVITEKLDYILMSHSNPNISQNPNNIVKFNSILDELYIEGRSMKYILRKVYRIKRICSFDQIEYVIANVLKYDPIHITSSIDDKYAEIFDFIHNKMLLFSYKSRYYASDLLTDRLFDKFRLENETVIILPNRVIDYKSVFRLIRSESNSIIADIDFLLELREDLGTEIYFDSFKLSLNLFYLSYNYITDKGIKPDKRLYIICYILAHNYLEHKHIEISDIESSKFEYQTYIVESTDYNFIFYDSRNKFEYLSDLNVNSISSLVEYMK